MTFHRIDSSKPSAAAQLERAHELGIDEVADPTFGLVDPGLGDDLLDGEGIIDPMAIIEREAREVVADLRKRSSRRWAPDADDLLGRRGLGFPVFNGVIVYGV